MGFVYPIAGILAFVISFFACTAPEPFDHDVDAAFNEDDHTGVGNDAGEKALVKANEVEMNDRVSVPVGDGNTAN